MNALEAKVLEAPVAVSLKRILIATDFSPASERALRHGLAIARRFGASVDIVHIVDSLGFRMTGGELLAQAVDLAQRDLEKMEAALVQGGLLRDVPHRLLADAESAEVWEVLCRLIRENDVDLVVLGTHGRTGLKKIFLGSVAEEVFRHSFCPVLTVGPCVAPEIIADGPPQHILFPTDLSLESLQALPFAIEAARKFGSQLTLLHVIPEFAGEPARDRERVVEVIRSRLQSLVPDDAGLSRTPVFAVESGYFPSVILDFTDAQRIDLIVLGLRSPEPYADRLVWQYAYEIVCIARSPVLTLRATKP